MRVEPSGPVPCDLAVIGEAPGFEEQQEGEGFVGKSGRELWAALHRFCGLTREQFYVTNLVKEGLPKNRDPKPAEVAAALPELLDELERVRPRLVVCAGSFSTRVLLGDVAMADVHGIPHEVSVAGRTFIVHPIYHPAAGLHSKGFLGAFAWDLQQLNRLLKGELSPRKGTLTDYEAVWLRSDAGIPDQAPGDRPRGDLRREARRSLSPCGGGRFKATARTASGVLRSAASGIVAVDTEGWAEKPWGLSYTTDGQTAYVIPTGARTVLEEFADWLRISESTVVMHNGLHDVPVLRAMGIEVGTFHDTMVLAFHDMTRTGSGVLEAESQNLGTLAYRELNIRLGELRDLPGVDLENQVIPYTDAVRDYAGADVIATWRLFHTYKERGLVDLAPYAIDMGQIPLVEEMIRTGIPFDYEGALSYACEITEKLAEADAALKARAARLGNREFNPRSHPQVRELITKRIGLRIRKRTKGGQASTNEKALADHQHDPFVRALQTHRELTKLQSTYLVPLLEELSE